MQVKWLMNQIINNQLLKIKKKIQISNKKCRKMLSQFKTLSQINNKIIKKKKSKMM